MVIGAKVVSDLFSSKYLFLKYLPSRLMVFIAPVAAMLMLFMPNRNWHFLLIFSLVMTFVQISQYYMCKTKHEKLLSKYGAAYEKKLEKELDETGMVGLLNRYWVGLEPDVEKRDIGKKGTE